ncbi:FAD-dependent oxidoreductase [Arenibacter sp. F20364]|uniref:NAD(P)/FAD-dependent oxidoreductase n=1 Tax=Arenibacter sp. F20364 TaxID=2926415 RepID=UPI001FF5B57D|nr:FAD-dependent oxidoreductase [Arenibacter sp. F20364]MCK0190986.1 FAD-dependent oxidoreductase [Arenibacter sp. F20364]
MVDYLIVGLGLAGISFCEVLDRNKKSFKVISDDSQTSSVVAGGLYNPVTLKRFTLAWNAKEQLDLAIPFYSQLEQKLNVQLDYKIPIMRRFASINEQNLWFEASDKPNLGHFVAPKIYSNDNPNLESPYGYGEVLYTGRIDTAVLLSHYRQYLMHKNLMLRETFDFEVLKMEDGFVEYRGSKAKGIVFATGFGIKKNPYFNYLPLNGTKGELLTIKAPALKEERVIKSSVFIIPMGQDLYRVGATYKWKDKSNTPTEECKQELLQKLNTFLKCSYEVVDHVAGIRPTVSDRKPLVGRHPEYENMYLLNGLGSRGVMIAPMASQQLYGFIENKEALEPEMDLSRFTKKHFRI